MSFLAYIHISDKYSVSESYWHFCFCLFYWWKVEITWDETDHERITTLNRKFKKEELLDMDFQAYLASSSEDEEEIEEELQGTC